MKVLQELLRRFKPLEIEDAFFGRLIYMKMPKGRISYWEAKRRFLPTKTDIELFIDAPGDELPPSELQRHFFTTIERDYIQYIAAADAVLRPEFEKWTRSPLSTPFEAEFTMTSFSIPNTRIEEAEWDISFESRTDRNHLFTVSFRSKTAREVSIDG